MPIVQVQSWVVGMALPALLLAGCLGGPKIDSASIDKALTPVPTSVQEVLTQTPHFRVYGPTTLEIEVPTVNDEGWGFSAALVRIHTNVTPGYHRIFGSPYLVAFIPLDLEKNATACQRLPKVLHYRYGANQGGSNVGNLTGAYEPGWYHLVFVTTQPSSYRITFNGTRELKVATAPGRDPYVMAGFKSWGGQRSYEDTREMQDSWIAFAQHQVAAGSYDLGWDMSLSLTAGEPCHSAAVKRTMTSASVSQMTASKRTWVAGMGTNPSLTVKASYKPEAESSLVHPSTSLELAWVSWTSPKLADLPPPS